MPGELAAADDNDVACAPATSVGGEAAAEVARRLGEALGFTGDARSEERGVPTSSSNADSLAVARLVGSALDGSTGDESGGPNRLVAGESEGKPTLPKPWLQL